jgi:membrane protease subunit (stomatin/prohibitin family)
MMQWNRNGQMSDDNQVSEQVESSEYEGGLDEEELAEVSGGGLAGAFHGFKSAGNFGGDMTAKLKSAWYGLKNGKNEQTESYALQQANQRIRQSNSYSALTRTSATPDNTGRVRPL